MGRKNKKKDEPDGAAKGGDTDPQRQQQPGPSSRVNVPTQGTSQLQQQKEAKDDAKQQQPQEEPHTTGRKGQGGKKQQGGDQQGGQQHRGADQKGGQRDGAGQPKQWREKEQGGQKGKTQQGPDTEHRQQHQAPEQQASSSGQQQRKQQSHGIEQQMQNLQLSEQQREGQQQQQGGRQQPQQGGRQQQQQGGRQQQQQQPGRQQPQQADRQQPQQGGRQQQQQGDWKQPQQGGQAQQQQVSRQQQQQGDRQQQGGWQQQQEGGRQQQQQAGWQQPQQGGRPQQQQGGRQQQQQGDRQQKAGWQQPQQGGRPQQQQGGRQQQQQGDKQQQAGWQQQQEGGRQQQQQGGRQQQQQGDRQQQAGWQQPQQGGRPQQQQGGKQQQQQGDKQQQQQGGRQHQQQGERQQQQQGSQQHRQPLRDQQQQEWRMDSKQPQSGQGATPKTPHMRSESTSSSSSMQSGNSNIVRGTIGRPGRVGVNYVDIQTDKMPSIAYHYDVVITPDLPKKFLRPAFEQFNRQYFPQIHMAYDGKSSFYTVTKLPAQNITHEVEIDDSGGRKKSFKITTKETQDAEIDLNSLRRYSSERVFDKPMRALQCLEVVLANPCHSKAVRAGRSFFTKPDQRYDLSDGYEMWIGLYQAAILGDSPFLNVDISHKSFPSECSLVDYIKNNLRNSGPSQPLAPRDIYAFKDYLKNIDIMYEPPVCFGSFPRRYKVMDISRESAASLKVTLDNKVSVTVADYFKSKGYSLKYPNWNCLKVGSSVKSIHLPIELCVVPPGQAINRKDGPRQVQQMIRYAATSTDVRKQKIMTMLNHFKHNLDAKVRGFGIQIGTEFKMVPMRVLKSPQLEYYSCELITPFKGAWRMNDSTKFLQTKQLNNGHQWAVIYSDKSRISHSILQQFFGKLSDVSKKLNVSLAPRPQIVPFNNLDETLRDFKRKNFDLVFVVIPRFGTSYAQIKQEAELRVGLLTQCIMENTIEKRGDLQTIANILLKVNGKLNGTNHRVSPKTNIPLDKVMFLGADVTHPSPDQKHIPSVVGVAASHDTNGACYNMQYRLQKSTCEEIVDMDSIFAHHLKVYQQYQGGFPNHVIYYRDGVSDGQFPKVRDIELRSIRTACKKAGCSPKLTCIIAIKRHHTRLFPETPNPRDKFNNVEPGTVVDRVIVHPNEVQFFMVSHQSIQGTAKPTRYNVLVDDAKMDINDLQTLTYNLCHMFPRCNRVVSYPAPAYLAHLVAYRGRVYIEGESRFSDPKKEYERRLVNQDFMRSNPMYFI